MICECENEAALNIFVQAFELTNEMKEAISLRRIAIWTWQNEVSPSLKVGRLPSGFVSPTNGLMIMVYVRNRTLQAK